MSYDFRCFNGKNYRYMKYDPKNYEKSRSYFYHESAFCVYIIGYISNDRYHLYFLVCNGSVCIIGQRSVVRPS